MKILKLKFDKSKLDKIPKRQRGLLNTVIWAEGYDHIVVPDKDRKRNKTFRKSYQGACGQ